MINSKYYKYPLAIYIDTTIKEKTKKLLLLLIQIDEYYGKIGYSNSGLAKLMNTSPRDIRKWKSELYGLGLIKIDNSKNEEKGNLPSSITIVKEKINEYFQDEIFSIGGTEKKEKEIIPSRNVTNADYYARLRKK